MTAWPATLPQNQFLGVKERDEDSVLRTSNDTGPASRRNRYTAVPRRVQTRLVLTGTQKQTFDTFFRTTLKNGSLEFDWEDPTTDGTVSFAFTAPPEWQLIKGGTTDTRVWQATLDLEIQP